MPPPQPSAIRRSVALALALGVGAGCMQPGVAQAGSDQQVAMRDVADLSLEELRDVVVSSVSRRDQPLLDAPASIYVITGDDIRRLGATTLPEALRLAPNLEVAALDARQYAITARGFNSNIANKLLVMQDGRTLYSPLFSGVFWDAQDFVPADIERIEVISGPAGATWGTNAVNGVINIVTKAAAQTQGPSLTLGVGDGERSATARYGIATGAGMAIRAHLKTFERDATLLRSGGDAQDAARGTTLGLRADWAGATDSVLLDAGAYTGQTDVRPTYGAVELTGSHLLAKWSRRLSADSDVDIRSYGPLRAAAAAAAGSTASGSTQSLRLVGQAGGGGSRVRPASGEAGGAGELDCGDGVAGGVGRGGLSGFASAPTLRHGAFVKLSPLLRANGFFAPRERIFAPPRLVSS